MDFSEIAVLPGLTRTGYYQPDGTFADWQSRLIGALRPRSNSLRSGYTTQVLEDVPSLAVGKLPTSARQLSKLPTVH